MIGDTIAVLRKEKRLRSYKLAKKVGISYTYLSLIERNKKRPTVFVLRDLAPHLGVSLSELLFKSTCKPKEEKIFELVKDMFEAMMKPLIEEIDD